VLGGRGGSNLRPQIPHLLRIKRLNAGINPPLPLPRGDSCSEISTVVPYLELRFSKAKRHFWTWTRFSADLKTSERIANCVEKSLMNQLPQ